MKLITTSWDDGDVLDFKLAKLLQKYNLEATFYIPQSNKERPVMNSEQIKSLSKDFEIGGHGLHHVRLDANNKTLLRNEIDGSYHWLQQLLGTAPVSFCFPGGKYTAITVDHVFESGYKLARTTELFKTNFSKAGQVTATTVQAYPHTWFTYVKHLVKRKSWPALLHWLKQKSETNLVKLTENYLQEVDVHGGCFHLWGHSWEIEKYNLWKEVEAIFKTIANLSGFTYIQNKSLVINQQS